jgi:hypothetical protein
MLRAMLPDARVAPTVERRAAMAKKRRIVDGNKDKSKGKKRRKKNDEGELDEKSKKFVITLIVTALIIFALFGILQLQATQ